MAQSLSDTQTAALVDILSHYDTYAEIRDFRHPRSLLYYGPPFTAEDHKPSTSPALQSLVSRFVLDLPGLRDLPPDFWKVQCHDIIENFEAAELSESYDKGSIGSRKTLATAISALIEYLVRGTHGGFAKVEDLSDEYDLANADDLSRAFRDFLDQAIYGNVLAEMVVKTSETDLLDDHGLRTQAVHEFVLVNLASLLHYTLILTPKGQYLVKLIDNVNKLIPYMVVRQTLKIGNVASMINGMVKVVLAKMSIASFTNWMGLTQTEDEGMNLLQQIISTVLAWDNRELESRASKIEKDKNSGLTKQQLQALKDYLTKSRGEHETIRTQSRQESISIVTSILNFSSIASDNLDNDSTHKLALDYLAIQLSIRDRKEITRILCHSVPDQLTTSIRSAVSAYDPVIRQLHKAVDLSDSMYDFEIFLKDLLKLARVPQSKDSKSGGDDDRTNNNIPTVGDFVQLLKKHQYSLHKFLHQCSKNGKELTAWYLEWAQAVASHFKRESKGGPNVAPVPIGGAGDLTQPLNDLFNALPEEKQQQVIQVLNQQTKYLDNMHASSSDRLAGLLSSMPSKNPVIAKIVAGTVSRPSSRSGSRAPSPAQTPTSATTPTFTIDTTKPQYSKSDRLQPNTNAMPTPVSINPDDPSIQPTKATTKDGQAPPQIGGSPGPGAFLARWQDLLESTPITPLKYKGKIQTASSKDILQNSTTDVDGIKIVEFPPDSKRSMEKVMEVGTTADNHGSVPKPDVRIVIECLGEKFRTLLAERSLYW